MDVTVSRIGRLALSAFVIAITPGLAAHAQPVPGGPEIVVDPEAADISYCPILARQADGSVAMAWSRDDIVGPARVLVRILNPQGELGPVTSIQQDSDAVLIPLDLTAVPGGLHLLWYSVFASEILWDVKLDPQARLLGGPRLLRLFHSRSGR
jgi:hypothetical protein